MQRPLGDVGVQGRSRCDEREEYRDGGDQSCCGGEGKGLCAGFDIGDGADGLFDDQSPEEDGDDRGNLGADERSDCDTGGGEECSAEGRAGDVAGDRGGAEHEVIGFRGDERQANAGRDGRAGQAEQEADGGGGDDFGGEDAGAVGSNRSLPSGSSCLPNVARVGRSAQGRTMSWWGPH
jgi:hypothetical protein